MFSSTSSTKLSSGFTCGMGISSQKARTEDLGGPRGK